MPVLSLIIAGTYGSGAVSDIEILWTLISLIGLLFSFYNIKESRQDLAVLRERHIRNGRWRIAVTALRAELGRAIIQGINVTIGIFAMTFPEPPSAAEPLKVQVFRFIFQWGFILSSFILTLKSYWNFSLRRELIEHGIKLEPHETEPENGDSH